MIAVRSFLRRIQPKTAFYFSLVTIPFWLLAGLSLSIGLMAVCSCAMGLLALAHWQRSSDKKKITNVPCSICGNRHSVLLYPARRRGHVTKGDFACSSFDHASYPDVYYCPHCLNGFLLPVALKATQDLSEVSRAEYSNVVDQNYLDNLPARQMTARHVIRDLAQHLEGKDVLEVGAYYGAFATQVQGHCKSYQGLEPSRHACQYVSSTHRIPLLNGLVEDLPKLLAQGTQFDTIVMFDVLEHLTDPTQTLRTLHEFLKPGGMVIFTTINIESSFSMALGPRWPWFMDMHYWYFSDRGYVDILHRSNFILKAHEHFSYYVYPAYFVEKALSCIGIRTTFFNALLPKAPLRITLGDTVMIKGQKV